MPATAGQSNCECRKHLDGEAGSGDSGNGDTGTEGRGRDGDIGGEMDAAGERTDGDEGVTEGAGGGAGDSGVAGGGAADSGVAGGGAPEYTSVLDNAMQATAFHTYQVNTVSYRTFGYESVLQSLNMLSLVVNITEELATLSHTSSNVHPCIL